MLYLPSIFRKAPGKLMLETRSLKGPPSPAVRQLFNLYENFTAASTEIIMRESILDLFRLMVSKWCSLQSWKGWVYVSIFIFAFLALLQLYEMYHCFIYGQCGSHSGNLGKDKGTSKLPSCNMMSYLLWLPVQWWILNVRKVAREGRAETSGAHILRRAYLAPRGEEQGKAAIFTEDGNDVCLCCCLVVVVFVVSVVFVCFAWEYSET